MRANRVVLMLGLWTAVPCLAESQQTGVVARGDSVSIRLVDVELRVAVQALAQFLDRPVIFAGASGARVTLETPRDVPRSGILPLLRGLLEGQNHALISDTTAGLYRVQQREPDPSRQDPATRQGAAGSQQLFVIRLRHAPAADVAATVNALFGQGGALGEPGAGGRPATLASELRGNRAATLAQTPGPGVVSQPGAASLSSNTVIVPDAATNSLLVRATQADYDLINAAVQQVDVRPLQVMIEVLIAEVRKDRGFSFGVDATLAPTPIKPGSETTISGNTTGIGLGDFALRVMNLGGGNVNATLRAAASRGDVKIVSRPVLLAANNEMAEILVGSQRPFVQVSRSLPTDAPQRDQVVQYKDVGTQLNVRPTISSEGYVMMQVTQEVNAVTNETAFDAPVISTRSVQTELLVRDRQTIVLGGLTDHQRDVSQRGVPLLSSIPILGGLFGRASRATVETELFVFMTVTVLFTDDDVRRATDPLQRRIGGGQ